ncbi:hypothetical protein NM688_g8511 [Phlebia brevispora]|uniref:Uncharacterized protein n=1 Tax=Phlebia brevispora TaxID=194682 RepID=A0ACC1RRV0_9APHY|nr:hypothetical protein NM688_g8511 [Phlebia brevispora]
MALEHPEDERVSAGDAWVSLHKTVRGIDENKVKDCKEDVDTLLVFAGLYSAVLTAFLIESYKNLQEDPQQEMIHILHRISLQISSAGSEPSFNPSLPPPSSTPTFHPSTSDICVNVCWFASLILSLSTASYAMLVKQWLREYLALDSTVPQECIRIRHFRYRGLAQWKLFEIAAMLPLILQLSLALFFVGLCFFTAEVHPSIGGTSVGMVGGWALFFSFAVLAPLLSARCPYKTTFLKTTFRRIRPLVRGFIAYSIQLIGAIFVGTVLCMATVSYCTVLICTRIDNVEHDPETALSDAELHEVERPPSNDDEVVLDGASVVSLHLLKYPFQDSTTTVEEDYVRRTADDDLAIFNDVDALLLDDSVLETMRVTLHSRPPPGEKVLMFVTAAIRYRLRAPLSFGTVRPGPSGVPDLAKAPVYTLFPTTRLCLVNILADTLHHALAKTTVDRWYLDPDADQLVWMDDALTLLVALVPSHTAPPDNVTSLFRKILAPSPDGLYNGCGLLAEHVIAAVAGHRTTCAWQCHIFGIMASALKVLEPTIFRDVVFWTYLASEDGNDAVDVSSDTFGRVLALVQSSQSIQPETDRLSISLDTLVVLVEVAGLILYTEATAFEAAEQNPGPNEPIERIYPGFTELLEFVRRAIPLIDTLRPGVDLTSPRIPAGVGLDAVFMAFFASPTLVYPLMECFTRQSTFLSTGAARNLLFDPLLRVERRYPLSYETLAGILFALTQYFDIQYKASTVPNLLFVLHLCLVAASLPSDSDTASRVLFDKVLCCIDKARSSSSTLSAAEHEEAGEVAYAILQVMDMGADGTEPFRMGRDAHWRHRHGTHQGDSEGSSTDAEEDENQRFGRWVAQFDVGASRFSDELIDVLRGMAKNSRDGLGRTFWRVRHLEDLRSGRIEGQNL